MVRGYSKAAINAIEANKICVVKKASKARLAPEGAIHCKLCDIWLNGQRQLEDHKKRTMHTMNEANLSVKNKQDEQGHEMTKINELF